MSEIRPVRLDNYDDQWFLYVLLRERMLEPEYNISHIRMPTFAEHVAFVQSAPYAIWDIIHRDVHWRGASYVTFQCEVGIYLLPYARGTGIGSHILRYYQKLYPRLRANIAKTNKPSIKFFEKHGFKLIETKPEQYVYLWEQDNANPKPPVDGGEPRAAEEPVARG